MIKDLTLEARSTRYGEAILISAATKRPIDYIVNTTFNELYNILPTAHMDTTETPYIGCVALGIGSEYDTVISHPTSGDLISMPSKYIHKNKDAVPFIGFPYILRKVGEDNLTQAQRDKHPMRAEITLHGEAYIGYWLRRLEESNDKVETSVITKDAGGDIIDISPLPPSNDPLHPTRDKSYTGETPSTNKHLRVRAPLTLKLSPAEISEILNAASIIFNSSDVEITEFAIVGGIDKTHITSGDTGTITYKEFIGAQTTHFSPVSFSAAQRQDAGVEIEFKIGQSMSMD